MVHAKFQGHGASEFQRRFLKVLAIYGHGGLVTKTIFINY